MADFMEFYITDHESARILGDRLEAVEGRMRDMIPAYTEIMEDMVTITEIQIRSGGRRGGGSYAALKPDTVRKKGTSDILYTAGANDKYTRFGDDALVKSVASRDGNEFSVREVTPDGIIFGTDRPYANVHQRGYSAKKIPARPFLQILQGDVDRWETILSRHMLAPLTTRLV
jgi:hypothetical protein